MINPAIQIQQSVATLSPNALKDTTEKSTPVSPYLLKARALEETITAMRRTIHAYPELAYEEFETSQLIGRHLTRLGYRVRGGIAGTGIVAEIGTGSKVVAIRAELDAVALDEFNQVPYRSRKPNIMHACGHDAHVATVLGAAEILAAEKPHGRIRIIMQPAEERADQNGRKGSFHMISNGALEDVSAILGFHLDATLPFGKIGAIETPLIDLKNVFRISFENINETHTSPLRISRLLTQLLDQKASSLLGSSNMQISQIRWGSDEQPLLKGSFQCNENNNESLCEELRKACTAHFQDHFQLAVASNSTEIDAHKKTIAQLITAAQDMLGEQEVIGIRRRSWTKEFTEYANLVPAAFFLLGTERAGIRSIQHTSTFDLDEKVLPTAAAVIAAATAKMLSI